MLLVVENTISMAMFNSYAKLAEAKPYIEFHGAIERGYLKLIYPLNMVIFHTCMSLPKVFSMTTVTPHLTCAPSVHCSAHHPGPTERRHGCGAAAEGQGAQSAVMKEDALP